MVIAIASIVLELLMHLMNVLKLTPKNEKNQMHLNLKRLTWIRIKHPLSSLLAVYGIAA